MTGRFREIQVVARLGGFAAAWIHEKEGRRFIEATELSASGRAGAVVEVGQASSRGNVAFFDLQAKEDELLFWWDDGENLFRRRMPVSLTGYALMNELTERFCGAKK